ncbi:uncharacterized protein LOC143031723 isoform X2 [Oratosquilla oratoria]|uniref:uncharacterized protein LOC143031723 isoform X2 n=1 Tax=Oratosquilla oratoria TaxID=337810 RepID=UPI003F76563F
MLRNRIETEYSCACVDKNDSFPHHSRNSSTSTSSGTTDPPAGSTAMFHPTPPPPPPTPPPRPPSLLLLLLLLLLQNQDPFVVVVATVRAHITVHPSRGLVTTTSTRHEPGRVNPQEEEEEEEELLLTGQSQEVSTRLQRSSTPRVLVDDLNQSKLTLQYVGGGANINHAPVRLTMVQQPSGAYNVTVYDGRVSPGDKINIVSRRRINFPFSMTVYEDAVATCRLSACCEFRYAEGRRLGGPSGHLRVVTITGGGPCFRCKVRELEARRHRNRSGRGSHRTKSPSPSSSSSQSSPSSPSSSKKRKKKGKAVKEGSSEESGDESDDVSDIENVDSLESSEEEEGRDHDSETNDDSHFDSESFDDDDDDDEKSKSSDPYTRSSENGSESSSDITKSISRYKSKRPASGFGNRRRNPLDNEGNLRKNSGKKKSPKKDQDKGNSSDEVAAILLHNLAEGNLFESDSVDSGKDFDSGREESSSAFNRPSDEEVASILGVDARTGQLKGFFATQMSSSDLDSEKCFQRLVISSESETERFFDDIVREDRALSTDDHSQDSETLSENIEEDDQGNSYSSERSKSEGTEVEEEEETSEVTSVVSTESRTSSAPEEVEEDIS